MTTPGGRSGRRAELRAKRRKQRQRLVAAGVASFLVLIALITVVLVRNGGSDGNKKHHKARTQQTLLFQLKAPDGSAISSALLADDRPSDTGAVVLIQSQVLADVPGQGSTLFGKALDNGGINGSRDALSDLMGVTIDGSWVIDEPTFQHLIDQVGGVTVDVDTTVLNGRQVVLNPGTQKLTGQQAVIFATYLASGEEEQIRLTRLQAVFDALLNELPQDANSLLGSLGGGSVSTVPVSSLANLLEGLEKDDKKSNLQYESLPVTKVDIDSSLRYQIDAAATRSLVDDLLSQSVPIGVRSSGNRVLVLNGQGTPGIGEQVRAKLIPAGFVYIGSRNANHFGYKTSLVLIPDATTQDAAVGDRVATALGLPMSDVQTSDQLGQIADVVVIIGDDYQAK